MAKRRAIFAHVRYLWTEAWYAPEDTMHMKPNRQHYGWMVTWVDPKLAIHHERVLMSKKKPPEFVMVERPGVKVEFDAKTDGITINHTHR